MTSFGLLSLLHEQEGLCWVWHCVYCSGHKALVKHEQVQYQNRRRVHKNCFAGPLTPRKRWMGVWIRNCTLMRHFPWGGGVRRVTVHLRVNTAQTLIFWCPTTPTQTAAMKNLALREPLAEKAITITMTWGTVSWAQPVNGQKWVSEDLSWIAGSWVWEGLVSSAFISPTFQLQSLSD